MSGKSIPVVIVTELEGLAELSEAVPGFEIIKAYDRETALRRAPEAEVLCVARFDAELFHAARNVRWVHAMMGGVEKILFPEFIESPIPLTCVKECFAMPGAQHALASMLAVTSRLIDYWWQRPQKTHDWNYRVWQHRCDACETGPASGHAHRCAGAASAPQPPAGRRIAFHGSASKAARAI